MKTRAKETRETRERAFLAEPMNWPKWPILPVMHRGDVAGDRACGFVHASDPKRVYFGNIFGLPSEGCKTWADVLAKLESREFPSPDALLTQYRID
jgi:hypothetical protein